MSTTCPPHLCQQQIAWVELLRLSPDRRAVPLGDGGRLAAARAGPADGGSGVLQEKVREAREAVFVARKSLHFPVGSANGIHPSELFFDPARQQRVLDPALMSMPTSSMVQVTSARSGALTGTSF